MRIRRPTLAVIVFAVLGVALPAAATTIVPAADPGELAMDSGAVFLARAGASRVVKRPKFLSTVTEFEVLRVIKGEMAVGDSLQVSAPGGMLDGVGWAVAGSPRFADGEVYLLFSDRGPDASYRPALDGRERVAQGDRRRLSRRCCLRWRKRRSSSGTRGFGHLRRWFRGRSSRAVCRGASRTAWRASPGGIGRG